MKGSRPRIGYTKGPWRIGDAGHSVFCPPNGNPSPRTIASDLSRADARLIATAPDLLEALKELVLRCDGPEGILADGSNIQTMKAWAAINKAKGIGA